MRANTIIAEIEVPQAGAETQRPVQPTLKIAAITFQRNSKENLQSHLLLSRTSRIVAGGVEHDHCP
jgi:hypothetical protein